MKNKIKSIEYRLAILREEENDRFYPEDKYRDRVMGLSLKHWNEYVAFDLNHEEVIEILGLIAKMRGLNRNNGRD